VVRPTLLATLFAARCSTTLRARTKQKVTTAAGSGTTGGRCGDGVCERRPRCSRWAGEHIWGTTSASPP
jgi:hypothetical protein